MKKIFIVFIVMLSFIALAFRAPDKTCVEEMSSSFVPGFRLNSVQKQKIKEIETRYKEKYDEISQKLKMTKQNDEKKELYNLQYSLIEAKDKEIMKVLNLQQKKFYNECRTRVY